MTMRLAVPLPCMLVLYVTQTVICAPGAKPKEFGETDATERGPVVRPVALTESGQVPLFVTVKLACTLPYHGAVSAPPFGETKSANWLIPSGSDVPTGRVGQISVAQVALLIVLRCRADNPPTRISAATRVRCQEPERVTTGNSR